MDMTDAIPCMGDHPFKTSTFFRGEGVKSLPNLPTDSSKKMPMVEGRGKKFAKFADG